MLRQNEANFPTLKLTFIDLFCGIGGFRQALGKAGHKCVFSSDWDPDAQFVYKQNYGELPQGDISQFSGADLPNHNVLCGGFPCQPFSISGSQKGLEIPGDIIARNPKDFLETRPQVLFLENVRNYCLTMVAKLWVTKLWTRRGMKFFSGPEC